MVLEKDGVYQLDRSCEKWRSITGFKEERYILHAITQRKAALNGHFLRGNCLLKHVIEGEIKGTERGGRRRRKQVPDDLKETRRYFILKEEELDFTLHRTRLGRRYGPAVRPTTC